MITEATSSKSTPTVAAAMLALTIAGAATLGVGPHLAAPVIVACAFGFMTRLLYRRQLRRPSFWIVVFLLYCMASGLALGGFTALRNGQVLLWTTGEGRQFLYFWPALYFLEGPVPRERAVQRVMRSLTVFMLLNIIGHSAVGFSTLRSHHAAGALSVMLAIYAYFKFDKTRWVSDGVFFALALICLLGSNSRTSLMAGVVAVMAVSMNMRQLQRVAGLLAVAPLVLVIMAQAFPMQFERLAAAANKETVHSFSANFLAAFSSEHPTEVAEVWDLTSTVDLSGNANVALRGYLFGRAAREFVRSPLVGSGFGRFNDMNRQFAGTEYLFYPVVAAGINSPSALTAHNTYLHVLAELGVLGALPLFLAFAAMWRGLKRGMRVDPQWSKAGRASLLCLFMGGLAQHSLGAPVYGLTLVLVAALGYRRVLDAQSAGQPDKEPAALLSTRIAAGARH